MLVVGTESLADEIEAVGLRPVREFKDQPVAVVQGHSPATGWSDLAEAALAIRAGALWVAANVDKTLPSERGLLPGNGSMVAALRTATDTEPQVAGKPAPTLMADALSRGDFHAPLVVGDRLDTDIAGAYAADLPSLMVLSGVNSARDVVGATVRAAAHLPRTRPARPAHRPRDRGRHGAARVAHRRRRRTDHRQRRTVPIRARTDCPSCVPRPGRYGTSERRTSRWSPETTRPVPRCNAGRS